MMIMNMLVSNRILCNYKRSSECESRIRWYGEFSFSGYIYAGCDYYVVSGSTSESMYYKTRICSEIYAN